ncbi:hypothetical protein Mpop_1693 [Methylorubrum populi BJ001]|jgi:protein-disulfide isomerase-like protein with CxxC motif|uniref:Uncharacterized protein n=1 Tax=Methylorubrum populi (strain ATCC BAA-705 / NCIMB 13946 / BJ001) TaxID=441620 RepID=B1ZHB6_METPB|nr:hypothetical protein [Methylorubrum populi]ACB79856.1 hypothetical protein Mpop_1693 [Methylorubrum populi BJ001]
MAGQPGAVLCGRAMPAQNARQWDHTYVASSCGLRWGCFGRHQGGREICSGQGDSSIADCLSRPDSTTGLIYGVTGVCHQAANWILGPANVLVTRARGYALSVFTYGTYGKNRQHPSFSSCYGSNGGTDRPLDAGRTAGTYLAFRIGAHGLKADPAASETDTMLDVYHPARVAELRALIEAAPGVRVSQKTFEGLLVIRGRLWEEQSHLAALLDQHQIDEDEFLAEMNRTQHAAMMECRSLLGNDFIRVFGEAGLEPEHVIDRDIFLEQHNSQDPYQAPSPGGP